MAVVQTVSCASKPGLGPAADLRFFASPKKRRQKKGDPGARDLALRSRQPALLAQRGNAANSPAGSDMRPSGATPLCCAARRGHRGGVGSGQRQSPAGHAVACPCGLWCWFSWCLSSQCRVAGPSSAGARGSGLALSERSEFSQTPLDASSAGNRTSGPDSRLAFLLLTFLWRSKEQVRRPPGRNPACWSSTTSRKPTNRQTATAVRSPQSAVRSPQSVPCHSYQLKVSRKQRKRVSSDRQPCPDQAPRRSSAASPWLAHRAIRRTP